MEIVVFNVSEGCAYFNLIYCLQIIKRFGIKANY